MNLKKITLSGYNSFKESILCVENPMEGFYHISWLTEENAVVVYEDMDLLVFDTVQEYMDTIKNFDHWFNDAEYNVITNNIEHLLN